MKKRPERSVRELYDRTETIDEQEMKPVLEGSCGIEGPTELEKGRQRMKPDDDTVHERNMYCGDMRAETGTCNLCAAPCSSCMHRIAMESNIDCEFSDNICHRKEEDICLFIGSKSRASPDLRHAPSEASNLLTSSSSHDSLSDIAQSKASRQATITFDTTETVGTSLMNEKLGQAPFCHTSTAVTGKGSCNNSFPFVHQTLLHKHESDCHVESDSCISGARDTSVLKSDEIAYMEKKDILCNPALKYNTTFNVSVKANEICNSVETSQNKTNKLRKCLLADPLDSSASNPKSEASVECKMVGDPPSRLFKVEDPYSNKVSGRGGCNKAFMNVNTDEQSETHIPVIDESPFLDSHIEVHVAAESQACDSEVLFDVNVCDICGDAGKEDRLATCSRCLDGAEHIYCMRNMLDKLPEGDWLCEECQMKEESEKKRLSKSGSFSRLSKAHQLGEKIQNSGISLNLPKSDMKSTDLDICCPSESMKSPKGLDNKHKSNKGVTSPTCKIVSQTRHVSTSPRKSLSCFPETSYTNSRVVKGKPSEIVSSPRRLPAYNGQTSSRSVAYSSLPRSERELHGSRKILQKQLSSSSLGLMPKPKQLLKAHSEVISRELTSREIRKAGTVETLRKSSSFKSGSSGHISYGLVSKSQILKSQRTEESKGFKTTKEGNMTKNKKSFVLERPVGKLLTNSSKPIQEVGVKVASNAGNSNKKSEGIKEMCTALKSKSHMMTDTDNKRPGDVVKGVLCANTSVAGNTLKNVGVFRKPQTADTPSDTFQDTKCMDSVSSGLGQVISGNDVPPHSHRLKHLNSTTDSCHDDKIDATCVKPSAKVNLMKRNRWKDAVEAAIDEKMQKRTKSFDPSGEQNESNKSVISEVPPKSSLSSKIDGKSLFSEAKSDGDESLKNICVASGKREGSEGKQLEFDLNIALPVPDDLKTEPSFQFMPEWASLLSSSLGVSSFPQHDFIWRGDYEISRTGGRPEVVHGIQAHLSFSASPKVPQVAGRFPYKIQLVEVPRVSSWPLQFQETSPTEESIALYFFAKDFESYEKSYQKLLNDMSKSDLALIGTINEVELLIFHSNTLPETSQRWNTLFFLWGVFRGRKSGYANAHANLQEQTTGLEVTVDKFVRESVSSFQKINSANLPKEKMTRSGKPVKASIVNSATCVFHSLSPAEARDNICKMEEPTDILKIEESPVEKAFWDALGTGSCQQADIALHSYHANYLPGSVGSFQSPMKASLNSLESNIERPYTAMTGNGSFLGHPDNVEAKRNFHVQTHDENANKQFSGLFFASESMQGDKSSVSLEETMRKISVKNETQQVTPAMIGTDSVNWRLNKGCLNLLSTPLRGENSMSTRKYEIFQDSTHFIYGEDNRTSKRMKYCSYIHDTDSFRDIGEDIKSTTSKMCLFSDLCSDQYQREDSNCGERMLRESKLDENRNSGPISFTDVSSNDDGCPNYNTIDLNLALGPSKRLLKGTFASVSQFNNDRTGNLPNFSVDDKLDISDSLSHALPMAKVGKLMQKSVKTENLYPEQPEGHSTSLPMLQGRNLSTPSDMK